MGRFYQTDKPTFVEDNIFKMPYQLAATVLEKVDADIAEQEAYAGSLYDKLNAQGLKQDEPRLREILSGYEQDIDEMTAQIQENPLEFRRKTAALKNLSRRINEDFTRGEVAAIQGNYNQYQQFLTRGQEAVKSGDIKQDDFTYAKQKFLSDFGGTNYASPSEYNSIYTEDLNKYIDMETLAETRGADYAASAAKQIGAYTDGNYIYEDEVSKEIVPYEKVFSGVLSALQNDQELNAYLTQQVRLGKMTEEEYSKTLIQSAQRVADKYSYSDTTQKRSMKIDQYGLEQAKLRNKKAYKKWEEEFENKTFAVTGARSSQLLNPKDFNHESMGAYASLLEESLAELKNTPTEGMTDVELREHNYSIDKKQAALNEIESVRQRAKEGAMRQMMEEGKVSGDTYNKFLEYQANKGQIDNTVVPVLNAIQAEVDQHPIDLQKELTKRAIDQRINPQSSKYDETFANAYEKYMTERGLYAELNEGEVYQFIDGLSYTMEEPNKYLNNWYKNNSDQNVLYNNYITIDPTDEDMVNVLDDAALASSGDAKILSSTMNELSATGDIDPAREDIEIDDTTWGSYEHFSMAKLLQKTGKKPSELFNVVGVEPSANGVRIIYGYDANKIAEAGIDELENIQNGETFMVEVPNSGVESLISDKYSRNQNPRAVEIAKAFGDPVYMQISNHIDSTIKDVTQKNFKPGPDNIIHVDGLRLNIVASKNPNGGFIYTLQGSDTRNGRKFNATQLTSPDEIKLNIRNYLNVRNAGKLK